MVHDPLLTAFAGGLDPPTPTINFADTMCDKVVEIWVACLTDGKRVTTAVHGVSYNAVSVPRKAGVNFVM